MGPNDFNKSYIFDPAKKITRIEVIIDKNELQIIQINFFSGTQTLVKVGLDDVDAGRVESFEIADDEKLIGCKLHEECISIAHSEVEEIPVNCFFRGVTWIKVKVKKAKLLGIVEQEMTETVNEFRVVKKKSKCFLF